MFLITLQVQTIYIILASKSIGLTKYWNTLTDWLSQWVNETNPDKCVSAMEISTTNMKWKETQNKKTPLQTLITERTTTTHRIERNVMENSIFPSEQKALEKSLTVR